MSVAASLQISWFANCNIQSLSCSIADSVPAKTASIFRDGNCLFGSLSFLVTGSQKFSEILRSKICDYFDHSPLTSTHYSAYCEAMSSDRIQYLRNSKMRKNGSWGGDLEIAAFTSLVDAKIAVYALQYKHWVIYDNFVDSDAPVFFLQCDGTHWEPVLELRCEKTLRPTLRFFHGSSEANLLKDEGLILTGENFFEDRNHVVSYASCLENKKNFDVESSNKLQTAKTLRSTLRFLQSSSQQLDSSDCKDHLPSATKLPSENEFCSPAKKSRCSGVDVDNFGSNSRNDLQKCMKCSRVATYWYPLLFSTLDLEYVYKRKFGNKLVGSSFVVCSQCNSYLTSKTVFWKNAWPAVMLTIFLTTLSTNSKNFFEKMPLSFKASWPGFFKASNDLLAETLFIDITHQLKKFELLISSYGSLEYIEAMNKFAFPTVRCFCGSAEFIENTGRVEFFHFLNYLDNSFVSFSANWKKKLKCIRPDFFDFAPKYLPFNVQPAIAIDEQGLWICTCELHKAGSDLFLNHVARHPTAGNISHTYADRLAPVNTSLRGATPTKVGPFSTTWTMSLSKGGMNGVGSINLHNNRNLNVKSDTVLPCLESLFLKNRLDSTETMGAIASEFHMKDDLLQSFFSPQFLPSEEQFDECVKSSTYIPLRLSKLIKDSLDSTSSDFSDFFSHSNLQIPTYTSKASVVVTIGNNKKFQVYKFLCSFLYVISNVTEVFESAIQNITDHKISVLHLINSIKNGKNLNSCIDNFLSAFEISSNDSFYLFWQKISKFFDDWMLITGDKNKDHYKLNANIILVVSNRKSIKNCPSQFQDDFQLTAIEKTLTSIVFFKYLPSKIATIVDISKTTTSFLDTFNPLVLAQKTKTRLQVFSRIACPSVGTINFFSGQRQVKCLLHTVPLCSDFPSTKYTCCIRSCKKKTRWRCPILQCYFSFCKNHFGQIDIDDSLKKEVIEKIPLSENCPDEDETVVPANFSDHDIEKSFFFGPTSSETISDVSHIDVDAGAPFLGVENEKKSDDLKNAPVELLFNTYLTVLHRPHTQLTSNLKQKRFFQCLVATNSCSSISLLQPEALLFPSIFYHQLPDGTCPGAIPYFLYDSDKFCKKYGFAGLLENFRVRLTDISLSTSSHQRYIQYMADCIINLNLMGKHTNDFFERGLSSLKINNTSTKLFKKLSFELNDTNCRVKELASAISTEMVSLFLTITCNQKTHPGVAPIIEAIEKFYSDCDQEIKVEAKKTYMSTIVRCWSRSVKYLIDLLLNSRENLVGKVRKIWGRAEFQTTAGNLPHYHILIWVEPNTFSSENIQCSEKNIFNAFFELLQSSSDLVNNLNFDDLVENCLKIHTHSCQKGGFRCMKRKDLEGNKVCRTPPYPASHCHWIMEIKQQYPEFAQNLLVKLGLGEMNEVNAFQIKEPLNCEKYMYAASAGEHMLPTNAKLFAITQSSLTLLKTTSQFSSFYLTHYSAKPEEHSDARITSGKDGKHFRLRDDGIQNKHLASVKFLIEHERKTQRQTENIRCQMLSITESVFWLLGLPYVFTNMIFIHIQNLPAELRKVKLMDRFRTIADFVSYFDNKINSFNFRNHIKNYPVHKQITYNQKQLQTDFLNSNECIDNMTSFSLRPPELLVISNVEIYFKCFQRDKKSESGKKLFAMAEKKELYPWVDCCGHFVYIRPLGVNVVREFLHVPQGEHFHLDNVRKMELLSTLSSSQVYFYTAKNDFNSLLPEIVFRTVSPRNTINFLVSFLLRFGCFHTELDLFSSSRLIDSFVYSDLLDEKDTYHEDDLLKLLKIYIMKDLRFQPGGVLTFSSKILSAKEAFCALLNIESNDYVEPPLVLIQSMHSRVMLSVEDFCAQSQLRLFERVRQLNIPNLPLDLNSVSSYWFPDFQSGPGQMMCSFREQKIVLRRVIKFLRQKFSQQTATYNKHQIILGTTFC